MKNEIKMALKDCILASRISLEEKRLWGHAVSVLDEDDLKALWEGIGEDTDTLRILTDNLVAKLRLVTHGDANAVADLIAREKEILESRGN